MFTIAICENNPADSAVLQNMLDDYELASRVLFRVRTFRDAETMLEALEADGCTPGVLLTEISLPGMSGIEAVRRLRASGFRGEVIFTASTPDYALEAYELFARQYIMKPVDPVRLFMTLEQILGGGKGSIVVSESRALRKIFRKDILYSETQGKHQVIHTRDGAIRVRMTAREMRELLVSNNTYPPPPRNYLLPPACSSFAALGASYVLNLCSIVELREGLVMFEDGEELRLSHGKFLELVRTIKGYRKT